MSNNDDKRPNSPRAAPLAEQSDALGFYLDALLMDLPEEVVADEPPTGAIIHAAEPTAVKTPAFVAGDTASADTVSSLKASALPIRPARQSLSVAPLTVVEPAAEAAPVRKSPAHQRSAQPAAMPLKMKRNNLPARPFAEPTPPQALLSAPPVMPLLLCEIPAVSSKPAAANVRVPPQAVTKTAVDVSVDVPVGVAIETPIETLAKTTPEPLLTPPTPAVDAKPITPVSAPMVVSAAPTEVPVNATANADTKPPVQAVQNKVPDWAQNRFQCLSFTVAGLTLAAPLEKLHGIVEWQAELTSLPGYASWFMGLLQNRGENVRIIDTAQIIMPDGRRPDARPVLERIKYVVLIDGGRWGLAVDSIGQVLTLEEDGVRWRGERSKRPWLAGTAVEKMCAVLDMDSLSEQLLLGLKLDD